MSAMHIWCTKYKKILSIVDNESDNIAVYSQIFRKQAESLNQSIYSVNHINMVTRH